jgi:alpha-ribazole phosphatase CobZ
MKFEYHLFDSVVIKGAKEILTSMDIKRTNEYIIVEGDFSVLSSAAYNGGFGRAKRIINLNVNADFKGNAFEAFDSFFSERGFMGEETVGMMTAVPMANARIITKEDVTAIITAGISPSRSPSGSTVNTILVIDKKLSQAAMANVIIVATEAKTAAFSDLDVHDEKGNLFTGDATDAVVVACHNDGSKEGEGAEEVIFAGKATELGKRIYDIVRYGVRDALFNYNNLSVDRPILTRLGERGISLEDMVTTALELYVPVEGEEEDRVALRRRLKELIKRECSDPNLALLLAAALHAEEEEIQKGRVGAVGEEDAACIVADELIGLDIAEYIGGKKALFNFVYYDTRKPGILGQLGVFMDDAIGGLIAGCMTKLLAADWACLWTMLAEG